MEHELVFWLEVSFQNGPPRIEAVQARDKLDAGRLLKSMGRSMRDLASWGIHRRAN